MAKEALNSNTHTKEARPTTGSSGGFGKAVFGKSKFGQKVGQVQTKEELPTNTHTKETLSATKIP